MNPSIQKIRDFFFVAEEDESGAVALLCLASFLALMLCTWVIIDAHKSVTDKVMLQGAADTAALGHAAIEARSMNMIAYGNVAKRSILDIHSMYFGMYLAYWIWIAKKWSECDIPFNIPACIEALVNTFMQLDETLSDQSNYSGMPLNVFKDGGNTDTAYGRDLKAIDNYQHYTQHMTPWWGFSEQLLRGWRNGATAVASFPPPPGDVTGVDNVINTVQSILGNGNSAYAGNDTLPIKKRDIGGGDWIKQFGTHAGTVIPEHAVNMLGHRQNSSMGAKKPLTLAIGTVLAGTGGFLNADNVFGDDVDPYLLPESIGSAEWLERTSNLTIAYLQDPGRMRDDLHKYRVPDNTYVHGGLGGQFGLADMIYKSGGYWTMSKSEIVYTQDQPDMWHANWSARMRPVHLPDEFEDRNYNMLDVYTQTAPYLAVSAQLATAGSLFDPNQPLAQSLVGSGQDMAVFGLEAASMGSSTSEGIAK